MSVSSILLQSQWNFSVRLTNLRKLAIHIQNLVIPEPDLIVKDGEAKDMVMKGLAFGELVGCPECLHEQLSDHCKVWLIEGWVKAE